MRKIRIYLIAILVFNLVNISLGQNLSIDTFREFPSEIQGCSCYFSNDSIEFKNNTFIYVNDFAKISFLKINGVITKFILTSFEQVDGQTVISKYKSDNYEITLKTQNGKQTGDETSSKFGTIKLADKKGEILFRKFYGECGC